METTSFTFFQNYLGHYCRYFRKYPCKAWENNAEVIFMVSVFISYILNIYLINKGVYIKKLHDYMSPFAVVPAVSIFFMFKKLHVTWKGIGIIASGVLAAYLITDHELPRYAFCHFFFNMFGGNAVALLGISIFVVIIASLIDNVVTRLLTLTIKNLTNIFQSFVRRNT